MNGSEKIENLGEIGTKARKLIDQQSWIRRAVGRMMDQWSEQTKGCESLTSDTPLYTRTGYDAWSGQERDEVFVLCTRSVELGMIGDIERDVSSRDRWWDALSMRQLREAIKIMPQAMSEVLKKMEQAESDNTSAITWLKSVVGSEI